MGQEISGLGVCRELASQVLLLCEKVTQIWNTNMLGRFSYVFNVWLLFLNFPNMITNLSFSVLLACFDTVSHVRTSPKVWYIILCIETGETSYNRTIFFLTWLPGGGVGWAYCKLRHTQTFLLCQYDLMPITWSNWLIQPNGKIVLVLNVGFW